MVRVIVADDSAPIRERVIKMLASIPGVEIAGEAVDGVEAIALVREAKPDLVLLDLQMPKLNGLEILPLMREVIPSPTIVIFTNFATRPLKRVCVSRGADFFFDKTTEFEKIIGVVEDAVHAHA